MHETDLPAPADRPAGAKHGAAQQSARASRALALGDRIYFGDGADGMWVVDSVAPPHCSPLPTRVAADEMDTVADARAAGAAAPCLRFHVSLNEEHSSLSIGGWRGADLDLGERVHHYGLLTLARIRLAHAQRGIEADAQGWVEAERLARMLGIDASHLNVQLYRARSQLAAALPAGAALPELIERRRGELRLAAIGFRIVRGTNLEGEYAPAG